MKPSFRTSLCINQHTGELMAVYFQIRKGKAAEVREFANGAAFANYSRSGELLGLELLAPCELRVLDKIAPDRNVRRFIHQSIPKKMALV